MLSAAAGFGKELFTDAGKYVVHFGSRPAEAAQQLATAIHVSASTPPFHRPPLSARLFLPHRQDLFWFQFCPVLYASKK